MFKKKKLGLICFIFACFGLLAFSVLGVVFALNDDDSFVFEGSFNQSYKIGEVVDIPSAKVGNVVAQHIVYLPDKTCSYADQISLNVAGTYSVDYYVVNSNGKTFSTTKSFNVVGSMFSVVGSGSVSYIQPSQNTSGILASLKQDSALLYNDTIDLTKFDKNTPFVSFSSFPDVWGEGEASQIKVIITDAYDENINLVITINKCEQNSEWDYQVSYIAVAFNGG